MASPTGQRGVSPFFCRRNHRPVFSADHIIIRRTGAVNAFFRFFNLPPEDLLFSRKYSLYLSESPLAISIFHPQRPPRRRGRSPQTPADEKNLFFFVPGREQWALARHICYRNGKLPAHKPLVFGRKLCYLEDTQRRQQTPAAPRRAPPLARQEGPADRTCVRSVSLSAPVSLLFVRQEDTAMQKILSLLRRCVADYDMIAPGQRIAVGVSGGKDSLVLLAALARFARFFPGGFSVEAFTVDMGTPGMDLSPLDDYCRDLGVPFHRIPTQMHHVIFETRQEKNPCALCAKMRRGSLHTALQEAGIHTVALGHHYDDAVETFFLSLFYEGRLSCFHPVTYLDRTDITQIRPLLYVSEAMIRDATARLALPVVHNPCPADGHTKRQEVKDLIATLEPQYPRLKESVFSAMQRLPLPHWAPRELKRRPPTE